MMSGDSQLLRRLQRRPGDVVRPAVRVERRDGIAAPLGVTNQGLRR